MTRLSVSAQHRLIAAASLLHDLWGNDLPPGHAPWERVVSDVLAADDGYGERHGLTVQADELDLTVLAELLSYVPDGASLRSLIPSRLAVRAAAAAARDPDGHLPTAGARLLSAVIRTTGCRCVGIYLQDGAFVDLRDSVGLTPGELAFLRRLPLPGDGQMCRALQVGLTSCSEIPLPSRDGAADGTQLAPFVATPFPGAGPGQPTHGALLLIWPPGADPDPALVRSQVAPFAAEAEHLFPVAP